ncbi:hypothetical protein Ahy_B10g100324 [Arachis hypogaea]|uniref:Uncharacterized protein n=1 Tax=Arachis hypogaea TaxID=3818 RepID=A0A444WWA5_ARAHY|nr:hypothetical protein Ahy_B10g100324 [Arachis hypogaea]
MLRIMCALTSKDTSLNASWLIWTLENLVERLDRGSRILKHLPNYCTDHTPICLQPYATSIHNRNRQTFHFVVAWLSHPNFNNLVINF